MQQVEQQLRSLINSGTISREAIANLVKDLTKAEKEKSKNKIHRDHVPVGPVTTYKEVKRNYTCTHCGHKFSSTVMLNKRDGDSVPAIAPSGRVMMITAKSPAEIECIVTKCSCCPSFIVSMSREELEKRYLALLSRVPFEAMFKN